MASLTDNTVKSIGYCFGNNETLTEKENFAKLMLSRVCLLNIYLIFGSKDCCSLHVNILSPYPIRHVLSHLFVNLEN